MNKYKLLADVLGFIGLFVLVPLYLLLPTGLDSIVAVPFLVIIFLISYLTKLANKGVVYDERMLRISTKSNATAIAITIAYAIGIAIIAKNIEIEWLTVPLAMVSVIMVLIITSRILFEIYKERPNAEG